MTRFIFAGAHRTRTISLIVLLGSFALATQADAQLRRNSHTLFFKANAGLSSYLGDNNTVAFNSQAFGVKDKLPYSLGAELGYPFSPKWSVSVGLHQADYPLITRFFDDLDIAEILSFNESVEIRQITYQNCIMTRETTILEPEVSELKFYCPSVGHVLTIEEDDRIELVRSLITTELV